MQTTSNLAAKVRDKEKLYHARVSAYDTSAVSVRINHCAAIVLQKIHQLFSIVHLLNCVLEDERVNAIQVCSSIIDDA